MKRRLVEPLARHAPYLTTAARTYWLLRRQDRAARRASTAEGDLTDLVAQDPDGRELAIRGFEDVSIERGAVRAGQKAGELLPLLEKVRALEPRRVCEIGTFAGGTL